METKKIELGDGEPSPPPPNCPECKQGMIPVDSIVDGRNVTGYACHKCASVYSPQFSRDVVRSGAAQEVSPRIISRETFPELGGETTVEVFEEVSPPSPEPEFIDFCESPCGHSSRYAFTENGGKNIECLLCNRKAEGDTRELKAALKESKKMNDDQIKHMVNRFLGWRLPDNFNPDGGISFNPIRNEKSPWPAKNEPTGTNLLDYTQTEAMIRYLVEGL